MSVKVTVSCPICRQSISYEHKEEGAWGTIALRDFAIVELTAHDGGLVREHMMTHYQDGTWATAVREHAAATTAFMDRLEELGK